jgi:hypothetical protein
LHSGFIQLIRDFASTAVTLGQLPPEEDPAALALELNGTLLAADASFVMYDDPTVLELGRTVVEAGCRRFRRTITRQTPSALSRCAPEAECRSDRSTSCRLRHGSGDR